MGNLLSLAGSTFAPSSSTLQSVTVIANDGTTAGRPVQTINFNGGTLQTSGDVLLSATRQIQTSMRLWTYWPTT